MMMDRIFLAVVVSELLLLVGAASLLGLFREEDIDPSLMPEPPPLLRLPTNPRITIEGGDAKGEREALAGSGFLAAHELSRLAPTAQTKTTPVRER